MLRPPAEFKKIASNYVAVRVTNMKDVDLGVFTFDYDLTFCLLLMNADGTIYHRFGGRDAEDPLAWTTMPVLVRLLEDTLSDHAAYELNPQPPAKLERRTIMDDALFVAKLDKSKEQCVHCHVLYPAERARAQAAGTWSADDIWRHPDPRKVGLVLDPTRQASLRLVAPGTPAAAAGLLAGDELRRIDGRIVRTITDVQSILDAAEKSGATLAIEYFRGGKPGVAAMKLESGWRVGTPWDFAWRPSKWELRPNPGFGGKDLDAEEKREIGVRSGALAFRVGYLITWGPDADTGKAAQKAGIKKGDIVLSPPDARNLKNHAHFQSWFRLTAKPGTTVAIAIWRDGKNVKIDLPVLE